MIKTRKSLQDCDVINHQQEEIMKDYQFEEFENTYGDLLEEVLAEVFQCAEEESESFDEKSIYELSTEKDIEQRIKRDQSFLDGESALVEDLELLEKQAIAYFRNPSIVSIPTENINKEESVTGFIQVNVGLKFDSTGLPVEIWRSFGQKLVVELSVLGSVEEVVKLVEAQGMEWTELVRVVFYGKGLEEFVGSKIYKKGERKELVPLCSGTSQILLAVPSYEDCDSEESNFSRIDKLVKESIQYGGDLGVDRVAMGHYELTLMRLEELRLEERENLESERILSFQRKSVEKRNGFDSNFKEARQVIKALNLGQVKIKQLFDRDAKLLGQVMYLCQKNGERIENPALFFQLKALAMKKKNEEVAQIPGLQSVVKVVESINSGKLLEVHLMDFEELDLIFKVLWSNTGIRISSEYKDTYFKLKERYTHLKKVTEKKAA